MLIDIFHSARLVEVMLKVELLKPFMIPILFVATVILLLCT